MEDLISIGRVVKTHGIRGQVKVLLYSGSCDGLLSLLEIYFRDAAGVTTRMRIDAVTAQNRALLMKLEGLDSIDDARGWVKSEVMVPRSSLASPSEGEYYWFQLIGLKVLDEEENGYGTVREIMETGSNDVYVARRGEREFLIPATREVVRSIDLEAGVIVIRPLPGLFDDHAV